MQGLRELSVCVSRIQEQLNSSPNPTSAEPSPATQPPTPLLAKEPWMPTPEQYDGDLVLCKSFLLQCNLVFEQQPRRYETDGVKISFVMGLRFGMGDCAEGEFFRNYLLLKILSTRVGGMSHSELLSPMGWVSWLRMNVDECVIFGTT